MAITPVRERLSPDVFRLPVEKIRDGYYSDAYLNHSKTLLEGDGHHPRVLMQVFQKHDSVLGGIDEAIAVLKECSGRHAPGGDWIPGWDEIDVHALHEGDAIAPHETVMTIEGDYSLFVHLETVYLGSLARRSLIMRNVQEVVEAARGKSILLLPRSPRPLARSDGRRMGGARRRARSACRPTRRRRGGAGAGSGPCRTD